MEITKKNLAIDFCPLKSMRLGKWMRKKSREHLPRPIGPKKSKKNDFAGNVLFSSSLVVFFLLFYHLFLYFFFGGCYGSTASTQNLQIENLGGRLKPGPNYSFPRFDCLPMWRWSALGPSQPQLMWGQHQGRPQECKQTNLGNEFL